MILNNYEIWTDSDDELDLYLKKFGLFSGTQLSLTFYFLQQLI